MNVKPKVLPEWILDGHDGHWELFYDTCDELDIAAGVEQTSLGCWEWTAFGPFSQSGRCDMVGTECGAQTPEQAKAAAEAALKAAGYEFEEPAP